MKLALPSPASHLPSEPFRAGSSSFAHRLKSRWSSLARRHAWAVARAAEALALLAFFGLLFGAGICFS